KADKTFESWQLTPNFGYPALPLLVDTRPLDDPHTQPYLHVGQPFENGICTIVNKIDNGPLIELIIARPLSAIGDVSGIATLPRPNMDVVDQFFHLDGMGARILRVERGGAERNMRALNSFMAYRGICVANQLPREFD